MSGPPSTTIATSGLRGDERDEIAEERLVAVLVVVPAGELRVDLAQLQRHDREALALEPADDLADEPALDGVGLAEDEGVGSLMGAAG